MCQHLIMRLHRVVFFADVLDARMSHARTHRDEPAWFRSVLMVIAQWTASVWLDAPLSKCTAPYGPLRARDERVQRELRNKNVWRDCLLVVHAEAHVIALVALSCAHVATAAAALVVELQERFSFY